jgi:hypothetical protein
MANYQTILLKNYFVTGASTTGREAETRKITKSRPIQPQIPVVLPPLQPCGNGHNMALPPRPTEQILAITQEVRIAATLGLETAESIAPAAVASSKKMVEEALGHIFKKPLPLSEALPRLSEVLPGKGSGEVVDYLPKITNSVNHNTRMANLKVTRMLGSGANELVLATESNQALKLGLGPLPRPQHNPLFDAPVLEYGRLDRGVHYFTQPIGDTKGITDQHVQSVIKNIRKAGYVEDDMWNFTGTRRDQVALFGDRRKPLLIDQGGAIPAYGSAQHEGTLVAHPHQQANLAEIREFLSDNRVPLLRHSAARPINPLQMNERSYSPVMDDWQIVDRVRDYLNMTGRTPSFRNTWGDFEVSHALRTLTLR